MLSEDMRSFMVARHIADSNGGRYVPIEDYMLDHALTPEEILYKFRNGADAVPPKDLPIITTETLKP